MKPSEAQTDHCVQRIFHLSDLPILYRLPIGRNQGDAVEPIGGGFWCSLYFDQGHRVHVDNLTTSFVEPMKFGHVHW